MKNDKRRYLWSKQRKERGFDDRELWSLDHTIAKFVLPRLIAFKEVRFGYPGNLDKEKWDKILDQIIYAMRAVNDEWSEKEIVHSSATKLKKHFRDVDKGIKLFGEYFRYLWW